MNTNNSSASWRAQKFEGARVNTTSSVPRKRTANEDEDRWVAEEDQFVVRQAKKKALIRVRAGRSKPIDWLAVTLRLVDPAKNQIDDDENGELDVVDPESLFEGLDQTDLEDLHKDITVYETLEVEKSNRDFWAMMKAVCTDRLEKFKAPARAARGVESVSTEFDRILAPKSLEQLETLETQVQSKLKSKDANIDPDYWEQLLRTLLTYKAKARLRKVSQAIVENRLLALRKQQVEAAHKLRASFSASNGVRHESEQRLPTSFDPQPMLKVAVDDKHLKVLDERDFLVSIEAERKKILRMGFVPPEYRSDEDLFAPPPTRVAVKTIVADASPQNRFQALKSIHLEEDEEVFAAEEDINSALVTLDDKYQPRKPQYYNRVQMGYEWNKYNQTHYDKENPPPKVVQGYKFNIFYPDLLDKRRAPTYKIVREGGRKRNQSFAPAGEEDSCLIRFIAGPPYEDIAFRIVDKEWDYSAKRERGFKSSFEHGILQLHFHFKKVYYRK